MMTNHIKFKIGIFLTLILAVCGLIFSFLGNNTLSDNEIAELRKDYMIYDDFPTSVRISDDNISMDKIVNKSDVIIVGEVMEKLEDYTVNLSKEVGSPENAISNKLKKEGVDNRQTTFTQAKIKVSDYWKGSSEESELIVIQNKIFYDYEPQLKPGDKVLIHLLKGQGPHEGKYWFSKYGFYYITDSGYVLSAVSNHDFEQFTGSNLEKLKDVVKNKMKD
jgi:hypothetical protein